MMSNPHIPTVEEMQNKVAKHKELQNQNEQRNDCVYFNKIFTEIPYFAEKGAVCYYMDESKLNEFIFTSGLTESRNYHEVSRSLIKKINNTTEYYSYQNISGLAVYWGNEVKERKLREIEREQSQQNKEISEAKEEPKKNVFINIICKIFK